MRVVHFCKSFSPLSQTFIYDYVTELECQGVDNRVLTMERKNESDRPLGNVTVVSKPARWNPRRLYYRAEATLGLRHVVTSSWPMIRSRLQQAVARMQPDVVHAHFGDMGVLLAPVAEALGIPLVVSFYGYDVSRLAQRDFWREAYATLWGKTHAVTVLSKEMHRATAVLGCCSEKIHTVHLGKDLNAFAYRLSRGRIKNFLSVGRLTAKKGHLDAIRAFEQVAGRGHDVHLKIVGAGTLQGALSAYVREHELQETVDLVGALPNADVARALRQADAFVLCSKTAPDGDREGTPTVLVEAQATGLPCVSTRHAGILEMIPQENHSLLAEEGNVTDVANCIRTLLSASREEIQAIAKRGRAKVEEEFNLTTEVEKLRTLYDEMARIKQHSLA